MDIIARRLPPPAVEGALARHAEYLRRVKMLPLLTPACLIATGCRVHWTPKTVYAPTATAMMMKY